MQRQAPGSATFAPSSNFVTITVASINYYAGSKTCRRHSPISHQTGTCRSTLLDHIIALSPWIMFPVISHTSSDILTTLELMRGISKNRLRTAAQMNEIIGRMSSIVSSEPVDESKERRRRGFERANSREKFHPDSPVYQNIKNKGVEWSDGTK